MESDAGAVRRKWPVLRPRGLAVQIVAWTVLPLTLVLIGVAFTGVYSHERAMRTLVEERDQALAVVSADEVQQVLSDRATALEELAVQHAFHQRDVAQEASLLAQAGDLNALFAGDVAFVDESAQPIAGVEAPAWVRSQQGLLGLVGMVIVRQSPVVSPVLEGSSQDQILVGVPVYDAAGSLSGVLAAPVSLSSLGLDSVLSQAQVGQQGVVYLVDYSGRVLAHSNSAQAANSLSGHTGLATALASTQPGATVSQAPNGERMALAYAPLALDTGWHVVIEQPWQEMMSPVLRYSQFMPLVAALAAIVAVLTLYYGVRSLVWPLRALRKQAERVASGDFEATSQPVGGVQEIEDLHRALDEMAKRIHGSQRGMHSYIADITQAQEEERRRLARELHDDTAQALIALSQQVEMAQKLLTSDSARAAERLAMVRTMLAETLQGVRRFSHDLRPIYLEDLGFIPALQMLASDAGKSDSLSVSFSVSEVVRRLPPDLELTAFRIVQEALNNVLQHAKASRASVEVRFEPKQLVLTVSDDGRGFEAPDLPDTLARDGHFGLMGIQERALLYGGTLTIYSSPGQGTDVIVTLAYPA